MFLGFENESWHLEFTTSTERAKSKFDEDDALVFYLNSIEEIEQKKKLLKSEKILLEKPKNPYWQQNGIMISDPEGFHVIFSLKRKNQD